MAISLRAVGTPTGATAAPATLSPGAPAGLTATDLSILVVQLKGDTDGVAPTMTAPAGWGLIGTVTDNGTLSGIDTGSNTVGLYSRVGTYTAPSISTANADTGGAAITAYATSTGSAWDVSGTTTGSKTTTAAATAHTFPGVADVGLAAGDWCVVAGGYATDAGTTSSHSITATGATVGASVLRVSTAVTTGGDSRTVLFDAPVTAGPSTAAPTLTHTFSTSLAVTGHVRFVRIREGATPEPTVTLQPQRPRNVARFRAANW